ncbi:glycosyltransferase family 4 protein [Maribacter algarum]|uniref:Glycosyltransferase family 4 protein n=1 Tax=Maribacter algarum (ex Zhang et al. 2020) TaxID=2578118 RepID=A0A5S3PVB5_9FLAO|nr:glycosyltransferase family 4 protein [Maribacter algarum]TMM58949.1 glycosyltransferase family 4 protein [Maribacter algarum]
MKKVLILTKTDWSEPPRIRHQITRLLKEEGYSITFVEKNSYKSIFIKHRKEEGIDFYSHAQLIHHQLRYFPLIQKLNNSLVKFYLKKIMKKLEFDFIMNFSYNYSFLKKLAPGKKIITMMEDDFEAQAKFGMTKQIRNQIRKTCQNSDHVLTVSYPLYDKLNSYQDNVTLFFPWSQRTYMRPLENGRRNTVLYFGFVGRLNWEVTEAIIKNTPYNFRFVGPTIRKSDEKMVAHLKNTYTTFSYVPYSKIEELEVDDVFCSILPYDATLGNVQATTVSNRAFNLLSLGLPLAYADLRNLIRSSKTIIRTNKTAGEYVDTLAFFHENFYEIQPDIETFLKDHYKSIRWNVLKELIES